MCSVSLSEAPWGGKPISLFSFRIYKPSSRMAHGLAGPYYIGKVSVKIGERLDAQTFIYTYIYLEHQKKNNASNSSIIRAPLSSKFNTEVVIFSVCCAVKCSEKLLTNFIIHKLRNISVIFTTTCP